jgi:hypothetical protein
MFYNFMIRNYISNNLKKQTPILPIENNNNEKSY